MPRKQKQKQRQKQQQTVVVNIHEKKAKKRRAHRKKADQAPLPPPVVLGLPKVPPIVVQYSEPASLQPPPPVQQPVHASIPQPATSTMFEQPVAKAFEPPTRDKLIERARAPERKRAERLPEPPSPTGSAISATSFADYMNPRFITPAPLRIDVPPPFEEMIGQPPSQETLAESLPRQMSSGGGGIPTRKPRGPYAPRTYPNRDSIIKQLVKEESYYDVDALKKMDTKELRNVYDLYRK
jgi:hypothetical protein